MYILLCSAVLAIVSRVLNIYYDINHAKSEYCNILRLADE